MTVYVDNMKQRFGRMVMSHMIADTTDELNAMVDRIGVQRRWIQGEMTHREHYDVSLGKRNLAVKFGAQAITVRELGRRLIEKRREAQDADRD